MWLPFRNDISHNPTGRVRAVPRNRSPLFFRLIDYRHVVWGLTIDDEIDTKHFRRRNAEKIVARLTIGRANQVEGPLFFLDHPPSRGDAPRLSDQLRPP